MNLKQMQGIYRMACEGKGYKGNEGQAKVWMLTMGNLEEEDLAQALLWYWADNTAFPMPAELKTLAEKARRQRTASGLGWIVTYECMDCHLTYTSVHKNELRPPKVCRSPYRKENGKLMWMDKGEMCGGILNIIDDRREVMVKPDQTAA